MQYGELIPTWFEGSNLPSDEEYDKHIKNKYKSSDDGGRSTRNGNSEPEYSGVVSSDIESSDSSDSDYDTDEFALSETYSTDDEDEGDGDEVEEEND